MRLLSHRMIQSLQKKFFNGLYNASERRAANQVMFSLVWISIPEEGQEILVLDISSADGQDFLVLPGGPSATQDFELIINSCISEPERLEPWLSLTIRAILGLFHHRPDTIDW